jgi:hypothetical protein
MSTFALKRPEWNLLASSILLMHDYRLILQDNQSDFAKSGVTVQELLMRIDKYNKEEWRGYGT